MTESHPPLSDWTAVVKLVVDTLEQGWLHVSLTQQAVLTTCDFMDHGMSERASCAMHQCWCVLWVWSGVCVSISAVRYRLSLSCVSVDWWLRTVDLVWLVRRICRMLALGTR